jgi:esterase/lipase
MTENYKKAVLIIRGLGGSLDEHKELSNYLCDNFDVFTFWLPGHDKGFFNHPKKDDWIKEAEKQIETLYKKGYDDIYVVGHSLGGIITSHLAIKYDRIKKIVLEAPSYLYNSKVGLKLFKYYRKKYLFSLLIKFTPGVIKEFKKLVAEHKDNYEKIEIPTLIIQGKDDILVPFQSSIDLYEKIPSKHKYLVLVNDLPHAIFYSNKNNEIMEMIKDFLINEKFNVEKYNLQLNKKT